MEGDGCKKVKGKGGAGQLLPTNGVLGHKDQKKKKKKSGGGNPPQPRRTEHFPENTEQSNGEEAPRLSKKATRLAQIDKK